jgi:hypothetical protein
LTNSEKESIIMSRIKEPSTWAGIASIFAAMASLPIPVAQPWLAGVAGVAGSVAVVLRETSKKEADVKQ